jgi:ATP-dependent RNA helicase DDX10/DBP4
MPPTPLKRFEIVQQEIDTLQKRILEESPKSGYAPPISQQVSFRSLPLSENILRGLESSTKKSFSTMTAIQNACIPHALAGRDILGAARTGSGKTLAFVIPLLEKLYREKFSPTDGCGAIVLSPTRELAVQIFDVLRQVGAYHALTAGLLVGGKKEFRLEQQHVGRSNILIATPGRLLQHLEQTPDLDVSNLQVLVLDEADRILDMGFRLQVNRILEYLPTARQTMLFSATQTRKISDLAALSLKQPEYLGVHDNEKSSTPESLKQSLIVVPLEHKLNAIYSFVKSHLKCKSIIFLASCSQVRHVWELFCALQPGIPVMALHGF